MFGYICAKHTNVLIIIYQNMKKILFIVMFLLAGINVFADVEIKLRRDVPEEDSPYQPSRSATPEVTASIDGNTITLDLTVHTSVEYSVTDESNGAEICYGRLPAEATPEFDLPANTTSGTYRLEVYAYGCWWTGTFLYY